MVIALAGGAERWRWRVELMELILQKSVQKLLSEIKMPKEPHGVVDTKDAIKYWNLSVGEIKKEALTVFDSG